MNKINGGTLSVSLILGVLLFGCVAPQSHQATQPSPENSLFEAQKTEEPGGGHLQLHAELPTSPQRGSIFKQLLIDTSLNSERAAAIAEQLGVFGKVTSYSGENLAETFSISNETYNVSIFSDLPIAFTFNVTDSPISGTPAMFYPLEYRLTTARDFIASHDLLSTDFRVEQAIGSDFEPFSVRVATQLPGGALYENDPQNPRIQFVFDESGEISHIFFQRLNLQELGDYSLKSAESVWESIISGAELEGAEYTIFDKSTGLPISRQGIILRPGGSNEKIIVELKNGSVETIDLEYYTFDFRNMSVNAIPEDDPTRLVQPVWRFVGILETGEEFENSCTCYRYRIS